MPKSAPAPAAVPALAPAQAARHAEGVSLLPENPRYFRFRGRPLALVSATEHYGSVINRAFDFSRYLEDAAAHGMTMTRTFLLFRELQSAQNPSSPCKPESPDYLAPWPRVGSSRALDGEPQYDLDQWNAEYFDRLHRFLARASELGIVVELTLFSNSYHDGVWHLNPLHVRNNLQGVGDAAWQEYTTLRDQPRLERQLAFARRVVAETARYDNVYYEICNEPGGGIAGHATPTEIDAWQEVVARAVREECARVGVARLVVGCQAFQYGPRGAEQDHDLSESAAWIDAVNVHPLPDVTLGGHAYQMGGFMSKELALRQLREFTLAAAIHPKPVIHDEDNCASCYRDAVGWTIHRKRAWMALLCGGHYDYIDFSITVGSEAGTPASRAGIRSSMRWLSAAVHELDLRRARPMPEFLGGLPTQLVGGTLGVEGEAYLAYLADARELGEPGAGTPIRSQVTLALPAGSYVANCASPTTGRWSPGIPVSSRGGAVSVPLPPFAHDLALRVLREA